MTPPMPQASRRDAARARSIALDGSALCRSELRTVPTDKLFATQATVNESHVKRLSRIPCLPPITVVRLGERYLIIEGHHRASMEIANNAPFIQAWVLTPA